MSQKNIKKQPPQLNTFCWYAVHSVPGQEDKIRKFIEKLLYTDGMDAYIKEILVPAQTIAEVKKGKKILTSRKLYPGYIFIKMQLYDDMNNILQDPWYFVRKAPGVLKIAGGDRPQPLTDEESSRILEQIESGAGKEVPKVEYTVGETVKIMDGPFLSRLGTVDAVDLAKGRISVSVSIFGRSNPLEFEYWQVQKELS